MLNEPAIVEQAREHGADRVPASGAVDELVGDVWRSGAESPSDHDVGESGDVPFSRAQLAGRQQLRLYHASGRSENARLGRVAKKLSSQ